MPLPTGASDVWLKAVALPDIGIPVANCGNPFWLVFGFNAKLRLKESCSAIKEVALKLFTAQIVLFGVCPKVCW